MLVTTDLGGADGDVYYKHKEPAGERLMLAALELANSREIPYSGATYDRMTIAGDKVILHFTRLGGGLIAKGGSLTGFTMAGEDRKFAVAEARIEGDTAVVSCPTAPSRWRFASAGRITRW
jgi:sialate O-acetylesterase